MDKILVIGDSHTYGDGLKDVGHDRPWAEHSKLSWPYKLLRDEKNIINKSYPGMCNDLMGYQLSNHIDISEFVIIMFSYPERHHVIDKGFNFITSHIFSYSYSENGNENWVGKQMNEKNSKDYQKLTSKLYSDELNEIQYLRNILFCQNLCIAKNKKYIFTTVSNRPLLKVNGTTKKIRDNLYKQIDKNSFFLIENMYGFSDYASKIDAKKGFDNQHWNEDYHKTFADIFYQYIKEHRNFKNLIV